MNNFWQGVEVPPFNPAIHGKVILVFGSNPRGAHGRGLALFARCSGWGATCGVGRGLAGHSYALVTKSLTRGFYEQSTGLTYNFYGGIPRDWLINNILELYACCLRMPSHSFIIPYVDGAKNLNGYETAELVELFKCGEIPPNVWFNESLRKYF